MIVKVLSRHTPSYGSLVDYLTKEGKGKQGKPTVITHNFKGSTKEEWVKEFMENESFRQQVRSDQIYLYHEIISLSSYENKDLITQELLHDLAHQYITLRGNDGMYIASFHEDTEHAHIHFAVSGVKYRTGIAHRLSHQALYEVKTKFQDYHKGQYPFLSLSNPDHGKGKNYLTQKEYFSKTKRTSVKETIKEKIHELFNQAQSQQQFLQLLQEHNLNHYERNGVPTGIIHEDLKFRFSRLDVPFNDMPVDIELKAEELQTLNEIRELREGREDRDSIGRER